MYRNYEPFERVFVDREEYLEWMEKAQDRCKNKSMILHLRGIGGIGKSSLIEHWQKSVQSSIVLDCSLVNDFYDRLDCLARGATRLGIELRRFNVLWQIRQRVVKGVEPGKEDGQEWMLDVIGGIPGIGEVLSFGKAMKTIGEKLKPILTRKLSSLGSWLQTRLGDDYTEKLLEILWKEPYHAQYLYLDAFLEDLNGRNGNNKPLLVMLDGYEDVDTENLRWRYNGKAVSEAELWYIFLSSILNCVGVVASRQSHPKNESLDKVVEDLELVELDSNSCIELLEKRGIAQKDFQSRIISVSGGNPFVISCICDIWDSGSLSLTDIENLGADTLEHVRIKTWRRLFSRTEGLLDTIDRAGLVPVINRQTMDIIAPFMKSAHWDQLTKLSFMNSQGDGNYTLHALARNLIIAELGDRLPPLAKEVSSYLENAAEQIPDYSFMGLAFSVKALAAENDAILQLMDLVEKLTSDGHHDDAFLLLSNVVFSTIEGRAILEELKGKVCYRLDRVAEAEQFFRSAVSIYDSHKGIGPSEDIFMSGPARVFSRLGSLLRIVDRPTEAEAAYWESIARYRTLAESYSESYLQKVAEIMCVLALLLLSRHRADEAESLVNEALEIYGKLALSAEDQAVPLAGTATTLIISGRLLSLQDRLSEAESAFSSALEIYRELAKTTPETYEKRVGYTLHRLAFILLRRHKLDSTWDALKEELDIFTKLDKTTPLVHRKDLARALGSIAYLSFCSNKPIEAEEKFQDSLRLFRELQAEAPKAYSDSVANRLNDLGRVFRATERYDEAEKAFSEALEIFQRLSLDAPEVYSVGECASCQVSITLQELGQQFTVTNRVEEAEGTYQQALAIASDIERNIPHHRHKFLVSRVKHDFAIALKRANRLREAEEMLQEALQGYRDLCSQASEAYSHVLASGLNNYANLLMKQDRFLDAKNVLNEAIDVYAKLSRDAPKLFRQHYAALLNNLGLLEKNLQSTETARVSLEKSLEICRELTNEAPGLYLCLTATVLNNLALLWKELGDTSEAENAIKETIEIRRGLFTKAPSVHLRSLATSLNNFGIILADSSREEEAETAFQEAIKICQELSGLSRNSPQVAEPYMSVLHNLDLLLSKNKKNSIKVKDIREKLVELEAANLVSHGWLEMSEEEDLWFHEIFYHWSDCPFCI
ncbi:MAG: tetratricopeptide repeat protein [Promethearchaeota archaeon]